MLRSIFYETSHDCLEYTWLCTCKIMFYLVKVYTCKDLKGYHFFWDTVYIWTINVADSRLTVALSVKQVIQTPIPSTNDDIAQY